MPANVETMFSVRETPWHGLGRIIMDAPASREALELAGLDWQVESRNIYSGTGAMIPGYRANVRSTDDAVLGVVSDRYRIVQNEEAFQFTDDLLGEGVTYETAGSLQGGKKVWMLARLPRKYLIAGDQVVPYLVIFNSHDGSSGVKVAMTPIRVVCQNTLNLALNGSFLFCLHNSLSGTQLHSCLPLRPIQNKNHRLQAPFADNLENKIIALR